MHVDNDEANSVVYRMQNTSTPDKVLLQSFMDMVVGVNNYDISNMTRQGILSRMFSRELKHNSNVKNTNFANSFDDIVSLFWESVFADLPTARQTGADVLVKSNGEAKSADTKCNPINYLRWRAITKIRNMLNDSYARNLIQVCDGCGESSAAAKKERTTVCKCGSEDTVATWPTGSKYRSKKTRKCNTCNLTWTREFIYSCIYCKSPDTRLEMKYQPIDAMTTTPYDLNTAEAKVAHNQSINEVNSLIIRIKASLPKDPRDADAITAKMSIFVLMTDQSAAADICRKCVKKAEVCTEACTEVCLHQKTIDKRKSCGAESFSITQCINYSKKIAEYQSCSASLASKRVKYNRHYFTKYIVANRDKDMTCAALYDVMQQYGLVDEYLHIK